MKYPDPKMGRREACHKIVLRHCQVVGSWVLIIDGVHNESGSETITNRNFVIPFRIDEFDAIINLDGASTVIHKVHIISNAFTNDCSSYTT